MRDKKTMIRDAHGTWDKWSIHVTKFLALLLTMQFAEVPSKEFDLAMISHRPHTWCRSTRCLRGHYEITLKSHIYLTMISRYDLAVRGFCEFATMSQNDLITISQCRIFSWLLAFSVEKSLPPSCRAHWKRMKKITVNSDKYRIFITSKSFHSKIKSNKTSTEIRNI